MNVSYTVYVYILLMGLLALPIVIGLHFQFLIALIKFIFLGFYFSLFMHGDMCKMSTRSTEILRTETLVQQISP